MARTQYPTGHDLEAFLTSAGFSSTVLDTFDLDLFAAAGWQAFNRNAGRTMLAVSGARSFDRPYGARGVIDLGDDLASASAPTLADAGTALTLNTDYVLEPLDAPGRGAPYNRLRFWRRLWNISHTIGPPITVTGAWGYAVTIPEDAWVGMLALGALAMVPQMAQAAAGGLTMWREADMAESYGSEPLGGLRLGWQSMAQRTAGGWDEKGVFRNGRYTRVMVG
jgi:hypothetical protein